MTDLKNQQIFNQPLKQTEPEPVIAESETFNDQQRFITESSIEPETELESQLEQVIRPKRKKKWVVVSLLITFSTLLGWQAIESIYTAFQAANWLDLAWIILLTLLASLGIGRLGKELWTLRRLRQHFSVQEQAEQLIQQDGLGQGQAFCTMLANKSHTNLHSSAYQRWLKSIDNSHSDAEIIELYDAMVVNEQDKQATQIVSRYATEAAVLVAISPLALVDMLLIAWRNFTMIDRLANVYGIELGYWSRLQLFKAVLVNMAVAGASELAIDASMDLLSMDLTKKLSARAGQGLGVGLLTARLGLKAIALLRPLPWQKNRVVKLSAIRKQIVAKITALVSQ
ncbi:YcjF family protein [Vibrio metschnikovii]|uniref:YcjF family protein n=1 Tax=Vibrio metschnikovii TaxID=28172 RepID=UPI001C30721B|nr:TIGR01620 family protein [Vibrio metschnikovii]